MSSFPKSQGAYLAIKFTQPLTSDVTQNAAAFTVSGQVPQFTEFPGQELGPLVAANIVVSSVQFHPDDTDGTLLLLTMQNNRRFNNVEGNLTVSYNAATGSLAGLGGPVQSFQLTFSPSDLVRLPNPKIKEIVAASINNYSIVLTAIMHLVIGDGPWPTQKTAHHKARAYPAPGHEKVEVGISGYTINLIHVNDINP